MVRRLAFAIGFLFLVVCTQAQPTAEQEIRDIVQSFEQALKERDLARIENLVAEDMVALENGYRNDGWKDFRDNHLIPEMKEPAAPSRAKIVKVVATPQMGWAYSRTDLTLTRKSGGKVEALLWSVYVLEKRGGQWKIVLLDWSLHVPRLGARGTP
jgi:ketosteroid isomerase-like protein